ncbi:MucBP domain-containing protein [Lentilactobacillus buchneri]|uniref:MucBP domain-containing protein n=1 Tax=Lentilactobacillus buchneri TaxID=1581 RepID=UPI001CDBD992|nr:MucBP domain-containing protein [Lentilactobacillus buchneri]
MKVNKYLLMSLLVISTGGILTFANADSTMTSNDVAHAATTQVADDAVPDGTIVTPMKVVKAPDPADKTDNPTIDPKEHSDIPVTNFYKGSVFHQAPVYVSGKLANPMGTNAKVGSQTISDTQGTINSNDYIQAPNPDETINYAYYTGSNAWMIGWAKDNSRFYLHNVDSDGKLTNTIEVPGPTASDFNPNWTYNAGNVQFSWQNGHIELDLQNNDLYASSSANPLNYLNNVPAKFVDAKGNELAPTQNISGYSGTFVDVNYPTIPGYRLVRVPYMNNAHQFLINNITATTPGDWQFEQSNRYVTIARKVIDDQNTQQMYMIFDYSKIPDFSFTGKAQSKTVTVKATPGGFIAADFSYGMIRTYATASMPLPVGNPLTFVYEPITEYHLTINSLSTTSKRPLTKCWLIHTRPVVREPTKLILRK